MRDIRTAEGREAGRFRWLDTDGHRIAVLTPAKTDDALDGLDIAQEMADHMESHPMTASGRCTRCKVLTRKWNDWLKGEPK